MTAHSALVHSKWAKSQDKFTENYHLLPSLAIAFIRHIHSILFSILSSSPVLATINFIIIILAMVTCDPREKWIYCDLSLGTHVQLM